MKPGYKQTDVGVIPVDWDVKRLPQVCQFRSGKAHEQHIAEYGDYVCVNSKFISTEGVVRKYCTANFSPAKQGDILMVMSDLPNGRALAKAYLVGDNERLAVNQRVCALTSYQSDSPYLYYYLNRNPYFLNFDNGVTQTHLLNHVFLKCPVPLPPTVAEQRAIATALSDVDGLIGALDALIAKKRDLKQATMQQLLTAQTRLPGFSGDWEVKRFGDVLTICHGRSQHKIQVEDGAFPILATGGQIGTTNSFLYNKPSVLIGRKGTIDQPQYMDTPFWTVDTLFYSAIRDNNNAKFIFYRFCLIDWKQYNEASGVPSLNARTIESITVDFPKPAEQTAIATVLSDMDAELAALEARREKTRALKQGMMQQLLTGQIRLV